MKACLLYGDREWENTGRYPDEKAMIQDLGLKTLFSCAARGLVWEDNVVKQVKEADPYLEQVMGKVMMVPLASEREVIYRQDILRDCYKEEGFLGKLYDLSGKILADWDRVGRRAAGKGNRNTPRGLVTDIYVLQLFVESLKALQALFEEYGDRLTAAGWKAFQDRLHQEFSPGKQADLEKILGDILFYANIHDPDHERDRNERLVEKPRMVLGCAMGDGFKLGDFVLEEVGTEERRRRRASEGLFTKAQDLWNLHAKNAVSIRTQTNIQDQAGQLEYEVVRYMVSCCEPFVASFLGFFDQFHFQLAFYRGAVYLKDFLKRYHMPFCFPRVKDADTLCFAGLREVVMGIVQHICPVGNTCDLNGRTLLLVTGANQGGKSTFLRSIGIAQVMLQCGLPVVADRYESGIYRGFFTHFTRREDSAMNSGRLDEELSRMSQIVEGLQAGGPSLVLLNESFATTTEREGSQVAYDVVRAMAEAGVKVLMVTHLLSFAKRIYGEKEKIGFPVAFLSAQRGEDGQRSYRMIPHEPELTSFGLELYDQIVSRHTS